MKKNMSLFLQKALYGMAVIVWEEAIESLSLTLFQSNDLWNLISLVRFVACKWWRYFRQTNWDMILEYSFVLRRFTLLFGDYIKKSTFVWAEPCFHDHLHSFLSMTLLLREDLFWWKDNKTKILWATKALLLLKLSVSSPIEALKFAPIQFLDHMEHFDKVDKVPGLMCVGWSTVGGTD